jgi:RND family efflux transporter MFP subunit
MKKPFLFRYFIVFSTVAALAVLCAACNRSGASAAGGGRPAPAVTVNQPVTREIVEWDEYPGRLEAVGVVEVRSRVTGYLESAHFKEGAEVKKGDLLFVIDPRPYQADLDRAQAEVAQAESKLELASNDLARAERLLRAKAISEEEADSRSKAAREAEAAIQSSTAMAEMARLNMEYTHITAPIDGRIGRKLVTEGNLVNGSQGQTTLLTTIVSVDPVYCNFDADEHSVLKYRQLASEGKGGDFRNGQVPCELELANETDYPHKGVVNFMDNQIDPAMGTLRVRGVFANPAPERVLQPGYFARVRVPGSSKYEALEIPDEAIGTDQSQKFVYVVNDQNLVEYKRVKLGPIFDGLRVVREGISSNDWVVVNGLMSVRPGVPVSATRAVIGAAAPVAAAR